MRHTLTGVWVEIVIFFNQSCKGCKSHPHGCVSWNLGVRWSYLFDGLSHPHGCVSWNWLKVKKSAMQKVTPSRVCELKFVYRGLWHQQGSHTLTGVWVEMLKNSRKLRRFPSHPHGCVSWNFTSITYDNGYMSHPHGCVSWNAEWVKGGVVCGVTPSRVCELKLWYSRLQNTENCHTLTGVWVEMRMMNLF